MAAAAPAFASLEGTPSQIFQFLTRELAAYPGRAATVGRITLAVALTFILVMTFRIPLPAYVLYMVFFVTRDTPTAAVRGGLVTLTAVIASAVLTLPGLILFADFPMPRFLYTTGCFFVVFYLIAVLEQRSAAINMGLAVYLITVVWDRPMSGEAHLQSSLWVLVVLSLGVAVSAVVEIIFVRQGPLEDVLKGIDVRLEAFEHALLYIAETGSATGDPATETIARLGTVGTGRLRRQLRAAEGDAGGLSQYLVELETTVALVGRLIDVLAGLQVRGNLDQPTRERLKRLAAEAGRVRQELRQREKPEPWTSEEGEKPSLAIPMLPELERTVRLIPQAFSPAQSLKADVISVIDVEQPTRLFVPDAWTNPEHLRFAVKGWLASTLCYIFYAAVAWPGISACVLACLITALSTLGASQQKLIFRLGGAALGGLLMGLGSLMFFLPYMGSITTVTLLIAAGSAVGAWFSTSSPKLSYFGSQTCLAFYLTTLQGYTIPTALAPARDAFVGVLVGLIVMWAVFEHLWPLRAAEGMLRGFASNLHLLAELMTVFEEEIPERIVQKVRSLRELINSGFAAVHAHADSMVFEFGPQRQNNFALRDRILRWQASARTLFLVEVAILQYRIQIDYSTVPEHVKAAQAEFDAALRRVLQGIAANVDDVTSEPETLSLSPALKAFSERVVEWYQSRGIDLPARTQAILALSQQLHDLITQLAEDVLGAEAAPNASEAAF